MMPIPLPNANAGIVPTYVVDIHSRTGFSGSPVWVYRRGGNNLTNFHIDFKDQFLAVLGVHYAQFPERWQITRATKGKSGHEGVTVEEQSDYVSGMSGMTKVVPASAILELLESPKLRAHFDALNVPPPDLDKIGEEKLTAFGKLSPPGRPAPVRPVL